MSQSDDLWEHESVDSVPDAERDRSRTPRRAETTAGNPFERGGPEPFDDVTSLMARPHAPDAAVQGPIANMPQVLARHMTVRFARLSFISFRFDHP